MILERQKILLMNDQHCKGKKSVYQQYGYNIVSIPVPEISHTKQL